MRVGLLFLCASVSLFASGCGLSDYEKQMAKTEKRLADVDEENELLAQPLRLPAKPMPIFLRAPSEILTSPNARALPGHDWLSCFSWADSRALVPPCELLVGAHLKTERKDDIEVLVTSALKRDDLVVRRLDDSTLTREKEAVRSGDPPESRRPIKYRRFALQSEEVPRWPGSEPAQISERCVYRYDGHVHDAGEWWIVVIFKQLDREATDKLWKANGQIPAEARRLPIWDREKLARQRELSLATLRVGSAASARFKQWDKP